MSDGNKLIPVYTSDQAKSWLEGVSSGISTTIDAMLIILTLVGFIVFALGIMRYMRAAQDVSSGQGAAEGYRGSVWMIVIGALLSLVGGIFIFFVTIGRSAIT